MTKEKRRGQPAREDTHQGRKTQPLDAGTCTCYVLRATVGEDHDEGCLLYRQRGSGICILSHDSVHRGPGTLRSASGRSSLQGRLRRET